MNLSKVHVIEYVLSINIDTCNCYI